MTFDGNGWTPGGVSDADREKAHEAMRAAYAECVNSGYVGPEPLLSAVEALGWGPGGVPVRPSREALLSELNSPQHAPMETHDGRTGECMVCPIPLHALSPAEIADALVAADHLWAEAPTDDAVDRAAREMFETPGVLADDEPWTWDDVLREEPDRAELWREDARRVLAAAGSAPVVDREALAQAMHDVVNRHLAGDRISKGSVWLARADALIASGIFTDRATVEAEAQAQIVEAIRAAAPGPNAHLSMPGGAGPFSNSRMEAYGEGWHDAFNTAEAAAAIRAGGENRG